MKSTIAWLKKGTCEEKRCAESLAKDYGHKMSTGGLGSLGNTVINERKIVFLMTDLQQIAKRPLLREFLLQQVEIYKIIEDGESFYPEGVEVDPDDDAEKKPKPKKKPDAEPKKKKKKKDKKSAAKDNEL